MEQFILFGTTACHLCEQAEQIVHALQTHHASLVIATIDIAEQPEWQESYATKIPVLYHPETKNKLDWPFDHAQASAFIIKELSNDRTVSE